MTFETLQIEFSNETGLDTGYQGFYRSHAVMYVLFSEYSYRF